MEIIHTEIVFQNLNQISRKRTRGGERERKKRILSNALNQKQKRQKEIIQMPENQNKKIENSGTENQTKPNSNLVVKKDIDTSNKAKRSEKEKLKANQIEIL